MTRSFSVQLYFPIGVMKYSQALHLIDEWLEIVLKNKANEEIFHHEWISDHDNRCVLTIVAFVAYYIFLVGKAYRKREFKEGWPMQKIVRSSLLLSRKRTIVYIVIGSTLCPHALPIGYPFHNIRERYLYLYN